MKKLMKNKLVCVLVIILICGFICGIVFNFIVTDMDKLYIKNELKNYFSIINESSLNYKVGIINSLKSNFLYLTITWLLGFIFILSFLIPFIVFYKGFLTGFLLTNIISGFKIKGILYSIVICFPHDILNILILLVISYNALRFSKKMIETVSSNEQINLRVFLKRYSLVYILLLGVSVISSLIEVFISSNLLKLVL